LIKVIDGLSIQKDGFHPIAEVFGAQAEMIAEEGLDTDPDAGFNHKSLLQEGEKRKDPVRGEIELDGEKRMKTVFEGMGRVVFHDSQRRG